MTTLPNANVYRSALLTLRESLDNLMLRADRRESEMKESAAKGWAKYIAAERPDDAADALRSHIFFTDGANRQAARRDAFAEVYATLTGALDRADRDTLAALLADVAAAAADTSATLAAIDELQQAAH